MEKALHIYNSLCDLDYMDYDDTIENDIKFMCDLLKDHTEAEIIKILNE